jgi:hypothetical protein
MELVTRRPGMKYSYKRLFVILKERHNLVSSMNGKEIVVAGAGPCGLRAAIELLLMGARVRLHEKRAEFSRANILHIWEWVVKDLNGFGAKILYPRFNRSCSYTHVSTKALQTILLKVALLLGAELDLTEVCVENGVVQTENGVVLRDQLMLVNACGRNGAISRELGFEHQELGTGTAIGLVVHFENGGSREERAMKERSCAYQFCRPLFDQLKLEHGADLENIVYYRGDTHYFVMTPRVANLVERGVLRSRRAASLLGRDNVDADVLRAYAREVALFLGLPTSCTFAEEPQLFDFSRRWRSTESIKVFDQTSRSKSSTGAATGQFAVSLVGDALIEPFWPEGLGINRGFLSGLDAAWAAVQLSDGCEREDVVHCAAVNYKRLRGVSGHTSTRALQPSSKAYWADPSSRYTAARE